MVVIKKKHKHWLMAACLWAIALFDGTVTSIATAAINLVWLMEE